MNERPPETDDAVWITGLGFVSSLGHSTGEVASRLRRGITGIRPHDFLPGKTSPVTLAAPVESFETASPYFNRWSWPDCFTPPKRLLRSLPPHGLYGYCALEQAFADAGWDASIRTAESSGFYSASAGSPQMVLHHLSTMHASETLAAHPAAIVSSISGTLNFTLGAHFGLRGANVGFVSACASSAHAIGYALDDLRRGRLDAAVILGAEDFSAESILPFAGLRALSSHTDPRSVSPFDTRRDGFVATGGAAALCLERASFAQRRGATPYARLLGWGQSSDGGVVTQPSPEGAGLALAIRRALRDAQRDASAVDYVNAHATATPAGDLAEGRALRTVFAERSNQLRISSTKHLTGHGLSMASALETALCALMIREGFVAGNNHLISVEPELSELPFPREAEEVAPRLILSNSSGFGGSNVVLAMEAV